MDYKNLPINTRIYYTGDQANEMGTGKITKIVRDRLYEITIPRTSHTSKFLIESNTFKTTVGRRFYLLEEWKKEQEAMIEKFNQFINKK
jgi:hypothetical protein